MEQIRAEQVEAEQTWCYVTGGIASGTAFVLFVFWCAALCAARRRGDPSRVAVSWLKAVFLFEVAGLVLLAASDFAASQTEFLSYQHGNTAGLSRDTARYNSIVLAYDVYLRTFSVGNLLRRVADVLLMISFVELGNGMMLALTRRLDTSQKVLRWVAISFGLVLIVLALAHVGLNNTVIRDWWYGIFERDARPPSIAGPSASDISHLDSLASQGRAFRHIGGAYNVLSFVASIGVLVYASVVMHYYARVVPSRACAVNLLLAALFSFVHWTWLLVVSIIWILPDDGPLVPRTMSASYGGHAVLDYVLFGVVLIILFSVFVLRTKGLWTTLQPWMGGVPPAMIVKQRPGFAQTVQQPMGYHVGGYPQYGYPVPNSQPMPSGWQHPRQQQPPAENAFVPSQESGGVARHESPPEGVIQDLGKGGVGENAHEAKA